MARSPDDGGDLLRRARQDPQALGELYDRHYAGIFRYCVHRLFAREAAEDVTSETFLQVARAIRQFAGSTEADFRNWLYAIASNQANAYIRRAARRKALLQAAVEQRRLTAAGAADCDEPGWPELYEAIAALSAREQTIVTLRSFEKLPFEEIAAVLDIKAGAARVAFSRALKKLRARLTKSARRA